MALSKSRRMQILLGINAIFFFIELGVGIWVHSLALVADSFHMLNDVLSLCVGLWAVKVAKTKPRSRTYTYGWQRAETLGALINGVFLVALCFSIIIEAVQRFFDLPDISNPKWILGVGSAGLLMNIVGLFLFHDHGHSHGGDDHGHSHSGSDSKKRRADRLRASEEGLARSDDTIVADERGNVEDVLPENRVSSQAVTFRTPTQPANVPHVGSASRKRRRSRGYSTLKEMPVHPASFRNSIIAASRSEEISDTEPDTDDEHERPHTNGAAAVTNSEHTPLLQRADGHTHSQHQHSKPHSDDDGHGHGHSHGDLNMRGVFLHVLGDALGNVGVIATALFIWLTPYSWRGYSDPVISLVIAVIILASAVPLCRAASRILLQAVPLGLNVDDIKADILSLPNVEGCHHLHVWQLSNTKLVASLHVRVKACDLKHEGSAEYMDLARNIRRCLHGYGIHSSTIQPEFWSLAHGKSNGHRHDEPGTEDESCREEDTGSEGSPSGEQDGPGCLLDCSDECGEGEQCCVTATATAE